MNDKPAETTDLPSINEPPAPAAPPPVNPEPEATLPPLPSDSELTAMTRAELDALAESRGLDSSGEATKADVIALLKA